MNKGWGPPTPHNLGRRPPNPPRLADGQGLGPPPTLHDLQIDKGWGHPQPLTTWAGRAPQPFTTCKWTRLGTPTMDTGWAPQPFTTCKWTRVGGPQPLTTWGGRAPQPFTTCKFANGQGWAPQPFTTCKWTRVGPPPNPSRLANRLGAAGPPTLQDLRRRNPQPFTTWGGGPPTLELSPNAKPKFSSWCDVWVRRGRIWFGWLDGLPRCEKYLGGLGVGISAHKAFSRAMLHPKP